MPFQKGHKGYPKKKKPTPTPPPLPPSMLAQGEGGPPTPSPTPTLTNMDVVDYIGGEMRPMLENHVELMFQVEEIRPLEVFKKLGQLLHAKKTKVVTFKGEVTDLVHTEDNQVQLATAELLVSLYGFKKNIQELRKVNEIGRNMVEALKERDKIVKSIKARELKDGAAETA
jgi:hypothetical protein